MRRCTVCGLTKANEEMKKRSGVPSGRAGVCKHCHNEAGKKRYAITKRCTSPARKRELRLRLVASRGGACEICGYDIAETLHFHHIEKGDRAMLRSPTTCEGELAKCILLCPNCHSEVHAGIREITRR